MLCGLSSPLCLCAVSGCLWVNIRFVMSWRLVHGVAIKRRSLLLFLLFILFFFFNYCPTLHGTLFCHPGCLVTHQAWNSVSKLPIVSLSHCLCDTTEVRLLRPDGALNCSEDLFLLLNTFRSMKRHLGRKEDIKKHIFSTTETKCRVRM